MPCILIFIYSDDIEAEGEVEALSQMDPEIYPNRRPWEALPQPDLSIDVVEDQDISKFVSEIITSLWTATDRVCGARNCKVPKAEMYRCEGCHEFYHLLCVGDKRSLPETDDPYLCPLHPYGKKMMDLLMLVIHLR